MTATKQQTPGSERAGKFRKKPVVVEAYQVTRDVLEAALFDDAPYPPGLSLAGATYHRGERRIDHWRGYVVTIHGQEAYVEEGDWVISEGGGEHFYPCKPDIFAATYEPASTPAAPGSERLAELPVAHSGLSPKEKAMRWLRTELAAAPQKCVMCDVIHAAYCPKDDFLAELLASYEMDLTAALAPTLAARLAAAEKALRYAVESESIRHHKDCHGDYCAEYCAKSMARAALAEAEVEV